jgi:hypothetical protein
MNGLFSNPVAWSGEMVKTWPRFWCFATMLILLVAWAVDMAARGDWRLVMIMAVAVLGAYQLMLLYAMRRMYFEIMNRQVTEKNAG